MKIFGKLVLAGLLCLSSSLFAKDDFKVATSIYVGWLPWLYAQDSGMLAKNAQKEGIKVEVEKINDYIESINLYTAGQYDGVTMTTMDALSIPSVGGIKSKVSIIGDYSNGNDAIISKSAKSISDLKGQNVYLVELSVSHYLLARTLDKNHMSEKDLTVVNNSDSDLATVYLSDNNVKNTVTWNPIVGQILNDPKSKVIADSSSIPYEILDVLAIKDNSDPRFERVLRNTWDELVLILSDKSNPKHKELINFMANVSGDSVSTQEIYTQIKSTHFFSKDEELEFRNSAKLIEVMNNVRNFIFDKGLYGDLKSVDDVGISFPNNKLLGTDKNINLKF